MASHSVVLFQEKLNIILITNRRTDAVAMIEQLPLDRSRAPIEDSCRMMGKDFHPSFEGGPEDDYDGI